MELIQSVESERLGLALLAVLLWLVICLWARYRHLRGTATGTAAVLVAYASQTGTAETLARATVEQIQDIHGPGCQVRLVPLNDLRKRDLQRSKELYLLISTTGKGEAPENARQFVQRFLQGSLDLGHMHFALLGLGDRRFKQFCGFAEVLEGWLLAQGASRAWETLRVDRNDPRTLAQWHQHVQSVGGIKKGAHVALTD